MCLTSFCQSFLRFLLGQKGSADRTHNSRIGSPLDLPAHILLHGPQNGIILKGAALNHNLFSQRIQIGDADYLGKNILDNGTAEAGHNILRAFAVTLLCYDITGHKDGAATAQLRLMLRGKGLTCNFLCRNAQTARKIFQEGAAAGGAGFVHYNIGDNAMIQPDCLHILTADIQKEAGISHILCRCSGMGNRLHRVAFCRKSLGKEHLAIARRSRSKNLQVNAFFLIAVPHGKKGLLCHLQRTALIGSIEGIHYILFFIQQDKLGCGASGVNTQIKLQAVTRLKMRLLDCLLRMSLKEGLLFCFIRKESPAFPFFLTAVFLANIFSSKAFFGCTFQTSLSSKRLFPSLLQILDQRKKFSCPLLLYLRKKPVGSKCRATGDQKLRMAREKNFLLPQMQSLCKNPDQGRIKGQGAALKNKGLLDTQSLGQTTDRLLGDGMKRRKCQVFLRHSLIQKRLYVCFCINPAAAGNIV